MTEPSPYVEAPAAPQVWYLEWAAAPGAPIPLTTLHRTEAGARRRIAQEAERLGADAAAAVEEERPSGMRIGDLGGTVWMLRELLLEE